MSHLPSLASPEALEKFTFERILNDDPITRALSLLGNIPAPNDEGGRVKAIIRIEKTALNPEDAPRFFGPRGLITKAELEESTDIVCFDSFNRCLVLVQMCFPLRSTPGYLDGLQKTEIATSRLTSSVLRLMFTFVK
jgi:hypothetical protein